MKRILVTGAKGQLGKDVILALKKQGYTPLGVDIHEMDLTDLAAVYGVTTALAPDAIIHGGAYTAVDQAEIFADICFKINAQATEMLALYAKNHHIPMIYISTDYVFDGESDTPYTETDTPNPLNIYGASKLAGEKNVQHHLEKHFIVRTSWVFSDHGTNFANTMVKLRKNTDTLSVVTDEHGSPTYTKDLAALLIQMLQSDKYGIYHATNAGFTNWYDFAVAIFKAKNLPTTVHSVQAKTYKRLALRPKNSRLSKEKLMTSGFTPLPHWQEAIKNWKENTDEIMD